MSCKHGNWAPCESCDAEDASLTEALELGKKAGWEACETCHDIVEGTHQRAERLAEELTRLRAEVAELKAALGQPVPLSEWQKMEKQNAELAALVEAKDKIVLGAYEQAPHVPIFVTLETIKQSLSLTAPDALKARDAATIRNVAAQLKADHGSWLGAARILSTIERMAEAVEKGEQL